MKESKRFIINAMVNHTITYIICGIVFSKLFNYNELFVVGNVKYFMREYWGLSSLIGVLLQLVRGLILGFILLIFKDSFMEKPKGWLRLWGIIAGIGIICTPAAAPFSIEGLIYSKLPLEFHLKIAPELLVQTLLFSILMTNKNLKIKVLDKNKPLFITMLIAAIGFSISGVILAFILRADITASSSDIGAFIIMFIALILIFFMTKWYMGKRDIISGIIYYIACYLCLACLPTIYNYISGSALKSPLSLFVSGLPVVAMLVYQRIAKRGI